MLKASLMIQLNSKMGQRGGERGRDGTRVGWRLQNGGALHDLAAKISAPLSLSFPPDYSHRRQNGKSLTQDGSSAQKDIKAILKT